ncbi:MAG: hypothetical protein GY799_21060 [Desulfobulbaceae bacterium]|nr:hypothetical protein [Desulfobulbaceae bacterium]
MDPKTIQLKKFQAIRTTTKVTYKYDKRVVNQNLVMVKNRLNSQIEVEVNQVITKQTTTISILRKRG